MQDLVNLDEVPVVERIHARAGRFKSQNLLQGEDGASDNFFMQLSYTFADFMSPRHRHNFDQVRIQLEGDADFARNGVMRPGTVGYFPEGVFYGPQKIEGESLTLVLQFGGASGSGYLSEAAFQHGIEQLKESGTFEAGVYKRPKPEGGTRNQDAYEAVWEHVNGRRMAYPDAEQSAPMFLDPEAVAPESSASEPGVERRHLGTFSEAMTRLTSIDLEPGAALEVPGNTVLFVLTGKGRAQGAGMEGEWEQHSSLYSGDRRLQVIAQAPSRIVQIELPRL